MKHIPSPHFSPGLLGISGGIAVQFPTERWLQVMTKKRKALFQKSQKSQNYKALQSSGNRFLHLSRLSSLCICPSIHPSNYNISLCLCVCLSPPTLKALQLPRFVFSVFQGLFCMQISRLSYSYRHLNLPLSNACLKL